MQLDRIQAYTLDEFSHRFSVYYLRKLRIRLGKISAENAHKTFIYLHDILGLNRVHECWMGVGVVKPHHRVDTHTRWWKWIG